jgi:hypothetical protein
MDWVEKNRMAFLPVEATANGVAVSDLAGLMVAQD